MTPPDDRVDYLTLEDLLEIGDEVVHSLQVRDLGLSASAAARPQASAFGVDAYVSGPARRHPVFSSLLAVILSLGEVGDDGSYSAVLVFCGV